MQPVYHEPYGARSPTTREAATLQIAVGRKGKTRRQREQTLSIKARKGVKKKRGEEKRPIENFSSRKVAAKQQQ